MLIKANYLDFGPTLAAEKLAERHGLRLGVETVRRWMIADGIWRDRRERLKPVHQPRYRRDCVGELIQIDGSQHWWFEDRGPQCTLLVFIDDATSRLMHLQFVTAESTFDYFAATRSYLQRYGKPVAFYSDKHATFRVNKVGATGGNGMTQFGRALDQLNIDIICANVPQAKGRVERANGTLQDRLVKELRLAGISSLEAGNAFLPGFMEDFNRRFAKEPFNDKDLHRPLATDDDIDEAFAWKEERTVSQNLTLQYDKMLFILEPTDAGHTPPLPPTRHHLRLSGWSVCHPAPGPRPALSDLRQGSAGRSSRGRREQEVR
ncbi:Integrase core domain-containing protein [Bosea lupini]|uniref:Integrase core domain-containing protein n=1 Tax=Bosea lupini TaxID=1036779 RepID=A0A1H7WKM1_9HYPH|nr:Integrase core domain-containing protein [Bosea lupini]